MNIIRLLDEKELLDLAIEDMDWPKIIKLLNASVDYSLPEDAREEAEQAVITEIRYTLESYAENIEDNSPDPDLAYDDRRQRAADLGFESIADMLFGGKR